MKKIITLFLILSLLLCMSATAFAEASDDGSEVPIAMVEGTPELSPELSPEPTPTVAPETSAKPAEEATVQESPQQEETEEEQPVEEEEPAGKEPMQEESTQEEPAGEDSAENVLPMEDEQPIGDLPMVTATSATYNVKIEWSGMSFTYHEADKGKWNPQLDTPAYEGGTDKGYWTSSEESVDYGIITITNSSDVNSEALSVNITFSKGQTFNGKTMRMKFSESSSTVKDTNAYGLYDITVSSPTSLDAPVVKKFYVYPNKGTNVTAEDFQSAGGTLGTITITISAEITESPQNPDGPEIFDNESVDTGDLGAAEVDPSSSEQPRIE